MDVVEHIGQLIKIIWIFKFFSYFFEKKKKIFYSKLEVNAKNYLKA